MSLGTQRACALAFRISICNKFNLGSKSRNAFLSLLVSVALLGVSSAKLPQSQAAELEEIVQRGYLTVAVKDNLRPLGFIESNGGFAGLEIDLAHQLAQELLGNSEAIALQPVSNEQRIPVLLNGQVDLVIARVTATDSRSRLVDFSAPYYLDGTAMVTRTATMQHLSDLSRQKIAVLNGSTTIAVIRSLLPAATLVGVDSYQEALIALESGRAIAFAADASILSGWVQEHTQYHLMPALLSTEALCVVLPKGNQYTDLRQRVNEAIDRLQQNGWLEERISYWGLPQ
jgi:polar amino acid transport system substrate-binding protein